MYCSAAVTACACATIATTRSPSPCRWSVRAPSCGTSCATTRTSGTRSSILCLGYGASKIKEFFLDYHEEQSNDFVLHGNRVDCLSTDISDWKITFVDTGLESAIGERLRRVRRYLDGDEHFLANYADVLTDAPLDDMIEAFHTSGATASMLVVPPQSSFHCVDVAENGEIKEITPVSNFPIWENGGYFVLNQAIFDLLPPGGDLVADVCGPLAGQGKLFGYRHFGFWKPADTFKERAELDDNFARGIHPWTVWETPAVTS